MTLRLSQFFRVRSDRYTIRFFPSAMSLALWIDRNDRSGDEQFLIKYLRPGDVAVDIGANIGNLALIAASMVRPGGRVIAVEPHPRIFNFLKTNLVDNAATNVVAHNVAVGAETGEVKFTNRHSDDMNGVSTTGDLVVPVKRLDDLLADVNKISLLKIDVEGYELFVVKGARETLARTDCVYFESFEPVFNTFGYSTRDLLTELRNSGFSIMRIDETHSVSKVDPEYRSLVCENLVAHRNPNFLAERLAGSTDS